MQKRSDLLLGAISNIIREKRKNNFSEADEWIEMAAKWLQTLKPGVKSEELVRELIYVVSDGVFKDMEQAIFVGDQIKGIDEDFENEFKDLFSEIRLRYSVSKKFIKEKKYNWKLEEKEIYIEEVEKEERLKAINDEMKKEVVRSMYSNLVLEMERIEQLFFREYNYQTLNEFFSDGEFMKNEDDLNLFFYHCLTEKVELNAFFHVRRKFQEYVDCHNKLQTLKQIMWKKTDQSSIGIKEKEKPGQKYENPFQNVFTDAFAHKVFQRLHSNRKDTRNTLADYSFIYRMMWKDKLIHPHQTPEVFRRWLNEEEPSDTVIDYKFKTLDRCTTATKKEEYKIVKELVQKEMKS